MKEVIWKNRRSIYGGLIMMLISGMGIFIMGNVSGYEAKQLINSSLPGINMLCNTIVLASATILALLLTLLGLSSSTDKKLKKDLYQQVLQIARFDTALFISALLLFQFFNLPITESEKVPTAWYEIIYWASLVASSFISGLMVTVIFLLSSTVRSMISIVGFGEGSFLIEEDEK